MITIYAYYLTLSIGCLSIGACFGFILHGVLASAGGSEDEL